MRLLLILLVIAVASLISPSAHAKTVRLKNGNSLHGEVEYPNEHQVVVDIPGVGKLTFHKDEIAAIEESSDQTSRQEIPPPQESGTPPSRETGNSQRRYQQRTYHDYPYYSETEEGLAKAQRALERAIKTHAVSEIRQLKDTIQRIRISLTEQRESREAEEQRERKKEQLEAEQRSVEAKQAKRAKSGSPGIGESAGGKFTPIEQLPTYLDPLTGRTCGVSGCQ